MQRKNDKKQQSCSRSNRTFEEGGLWYINTREGNVIGPFRDVLEASTQLEVYIRMADSGMLLEEDTYTAQRVASKKTG